MAKVRDRAACCLIIYLQNCCKRYIESAKRINGLKLDSIGNYMFIKIYLLKKATKGCAITRWQLQGKKFGLRSMMHMTNNP